MVGPYARHIVTAVALVAALGFAAGPAHAVTELLSNGDFETGDFTGWTNTASVGGLGFNINDGSFDPEGPGGPLAPINGEFDAVSAQLGPGMNTISQTVTIPHGLTDATLSWSDRIRNFANDYQDPPHEYRVVLRDLTGALIAEIFSTDPGDPLQQVGPNHRSFDVLPHVQNRGGEQVVVAWEQQDFLFFFNATVDDASFTVVPLPATAFAGLPLLGLAALARRRLAR